MVQRSTLDARLEPEVPRSWAVQPHVPRATSLELEWLKDPATYCVPSMMRSIALDRSEAELSLYLGRKEVNLS